MQYPLTTRDWNFYAGDKPFTWVGLNAALLHNRHMLYKQGDQSMDVRPFLDKISSYKNGGPNILTVFSMVGWGATRVTPIGIKSYAPRFHKPYYYDTLEDLAQNVLPAYKKYMELVVFASSQFLGDDMHPGDGRPWCPPEDQLPHWQTCDTIMHKYNAGTMRLGNEIYTHDNGPDFPPSHFAGRSVPCTIGGQGEATSIPTPGWDYNIYQPTRDSDQGPDFPNDSDGLWPNWLFQMSQACMIMRDKHSVTNPRPLVLGEPIGLAEVAIPGHRFSSRRNAALIANQVFLWGAGLVLWPNYGLQTVLPGPNQDAASADFFTAAWSQFT